MSKQNAKSIRNVSKHTTSSKFSSTCRLRTLCIIHLVLSLVATGDATYSSFKPTCTLPPPDTNFVSRPGTRGTMSILWNCLSIILLCTWSIQHLNVPAGRTRDASKWKKFWWTILDLRKKVKWMLFTILVPEYLLGMALSDLLAAKRGHEIMKEHGWEETHVRLANLGHFVLHFEESLDSTTLHTQKPLSSTNIPEITRINLNDEAENTSNIESAESVPLVPVHARDGSTESDKDWNFEKLSANLKSLGNFKSHFTQARWKEILQEIERLPGRSWVLNTSQWAFVLENDIAEPIEAEARTLEMLNHSGTFVKFLALLQVGYLIIQLSARRIAHLPSSQLEITALAFSVSSFVTYILLWNKPQGVESIHIVEAKRNPTCKEVADIADYGPGFTTWDSYRPDDDYRFIPIPNDASHGDKRNDINDLGSLLGIPLGGVLFGIVHCLAWNFQFPTSGEAIVWRVCSVVISAFPVIFLLYFWMGGITWAERIHLPTFLEGCSVVGTILLYIPARLFLIGEVFRTLFYLPPDAFIETWSGSFPHFG